ncbi:MAG: tetratricopeptide repeat protein [Thermoanaerobaculia bacterium]
MKIPTETTSARVERSEALVRLGELLMQLQERLGDAEEHFRAVLAGDASHPGALAGMAEIRMHQKKDREALELLGGAMAAGAADFR